MLMWRLRWSWIPHYSANPAAAPAVEDQIPLPFPSSILRLIQTFVSTAVTLKHYRIIKNNADRFRQPIPPQPYAVEYTCTWERNNHICILRVVDTKLLTTNKCQQLAAQFLRHRIKAYYPYYPRGNHFDILPHHELRQRRGFDSDMCLSTATKKLRTH